VSKTRLYSTAKSKNPLKGCLLILTLCLFYSATAYPKETSRIPPSDGFDFPVGAPNASGYYKARGFWTGTHPGEDWNGIGGGNSDLGDPVYSIGSGLVILSRDVGAGWGNVVIIRHLYLDDAKHIRIIDSLYAHLRERLVELGSEVTRGQMLGTIGTADGKYLAHLHFEIRKNLKIGMRRSSFASDYANYHNPTKFIKEHRNTTTNRKTYAIPTGFKGASESVSLTGKLITPESKKPIEIISRKAKSIRERITFQKKSTNSSSEKELEPEPKGGDWKKIEKFWKDLFKKP